MRYCLKHYTEDLEGGTFTLAESEELKGITDAVITPTPKDYEGFTPITPIAKYTITIPSTPGEIRYSRNTYTLSFDLDGGSFPASATFTGGKFLYEQHVTTAVSPVKQGYTFDSWSTDVPETMPAQDLTIKALWTPNDNTPYVIKATPHKDRLSALYASCLHLFRHIAQIYLEIR